MNKFFKYCTDSIDEWRGRRLAKVAIKSTEDFIRQILDAPPAEARRQIGQFKSQAACHAGHVSKLDAATADMLLEIVYQLELILNIRADATHKLEAAAACINTLVGNRLALALERARDTQQTDDKPC